MGLWSPHCGGQQAFAELLFRQCCDILNVSLFDFVLVFAAHFVHKLSIHGSLLVKILGLMPRIAFLAHDAETLRRAAVATLRRWGS